VPSPGLDVHLDAFETNANSQVRYLSTSPEYQMKRLLAAGHERIFQIVRAFRRGELGAVHNPEFTMLEFYRAHAGVQDIMRDTEQLVAALSGGSVQLGSRNVSTLPPFAKMTVAEAFASFASTSEAEMLDLAASNETEFYLRLVDRVEPALAQLPHAVFLHRYPLQQASLARPCDDDPRYAERFELYVAGVEICNGFGELTDARVQRQRFAADQTARAAQGLPVYPMDERFLAALETGLAPCAGNAIGLDRLMALCTGHREIAPLLAFTHDEL
jgi:lysyl-tRNA synthetase class 2